MRRIAPLMVLLVVAVGCGGGEESVNTSTPDTTAGALEADFTVTVLEEGGCTLEGPSQVPPGDYAFLLVNPTGDYWEFKTTKIVDGHTFQDLLDDQGTPGAAVYSRPPWLEDEEETFFDPNPHGNYRRGWRLTPGVHEVHAYYQTGSTVEHWYCSHFEVTDQ